MATKKVLEGRLRETTDALLCGASSELRWFSYQPSFGGDGHWSSWAAEARASYELLGVADSFWELATCFGMVPTVVAVPLSGGDAA